jgi:Bacterial TniB protein
MIILDESHRLRPKTFSEVRDIFDLLGISVVLVGTDWLDAVVRRDEQVYNRFIACHRFHRMDSPTLEVTTAVWEAYVLWLPQLSNLTSAPMQKILGTSTRGYLGVLDDILRNAVRRALKSGQSRIDYWLKAPESSGIRVPLMSSEGWLFRVKAYRGESLGHFLGRFRRANALSHKSLAEHLSIRVEWIRHRGDEPPPGCNWLPSWN